MNVDKQYSIRPEADRMHCPIVFSTNLGCIITCIQKALEQCREGSAESGRDEPHTLWEVYGPPLLVPPLGSAPVRRVSSLH